MLFVGHAFIKGKGKDAKPKKDSIWGVMKAEALVAKRTGITTKKSFRIGVFASRPDKNLLGVVDVNGAPLQGTEFDTAITDKFLPLLDPKYRFVSMRCGRGSGKSLPEQVELPIRRLTDSVAVTFGSVALDSEKVGMDASVLRGVQPVWHLANAIPLVTFGVAIQRWVVRIELNGLSQGFRRDAELLHASTNPDNEAVACLAVSYFSFHRFKVDVASDVLYAPQWC